MSGMRRWSRADVGFVAAAAVITGLAAALRFWALDFGLPHLETRPDETPVIRLAAKVGRGQLDLGWGMYPDAYVYLTWLQGELGAKLLGLLGRADATGYTRLLQSEPAKIYLIGRVFAALAGTAAVAGLIALARRTSGRAVALVAGLLLATAFLHARDSHAAKPDALLSLWTVAGLAASVALARAATLRRGIVAGLVLGAAVATKYPGVLVSVPIYFGAVLGSSARGWRRLVPGPALAAGATGLVLFVATSPFMITAEEFRAWAFDFARLLFPSLSAGIPGAQPAPPAMSAGPEPSPYGPAAWWGGYTYHALFSLRHGIGLPAALLALPALIFALVRRSPVLVLAAAFSVAYFALFGLSPARLARYMTPMLPALALLEAEAVVALGARLGGRRGTALVALLTAVLVAPPLASSVRHNRVAEREDTRVLASRWMREHLPRDASVAVLGTRFWAWGAPRLPSRVQGHFPRQDRDVLDLQEVDFVVTHDHPLFSSTLDRDTWKEIAPRARLLAEFDPFRGDGETPVFENADAYYVPFAGFGGVTRPGPRIRIYAVEPADGEATPRSPAPGEPPRASAAPRG